MPRPARACGGNARRSWPSNSMLPLVGVRWPMRLRISVVLPAPFLPTTPTMRPLGTSIDRPRSATTVSIATCGDFTESIVVSFREQLAGDVAADIVGGERLLRRVVGDDAAGVERDHAARVALDDVHVVLDEENGRGLVAERAHDRVHHRELLLCRDAARRLVQE